MTNREIEVFDLYAAHALTGLLSVSHDGDSDLDEIPADFPTSQISECEYIAARAFDIAEAMLEERKRRLDASSELAQSGE